VARTRGTWLHLTEEQHSRLKPEYFFNGGILFVAFCIQEIVISPVLACNSSLRRRSMNTLQCPHLDRLGRELIDAYRNLDDDEVFALGGADSSENPIQKIHREMAEHRQMCAICRWYAWPPALKVSAKSPEHLPSK
jgi:hypothetical protein